VNCLSAYTGSIRFLNITVNFANASITVRLVQAVVAAIALFLVWWMLRLYVP
jgi:hypothetical protein